MQIINVDLIPGKVMPILHASQFDKGRSLGVKLYNGGAVFELSGAEDLTAAVRKPDGNIVTETLTNAGGSLVEIITTEQMTACAGGSLCEIKIEDSGDVIGTANFVLEVEKDPTDGGIASQSEINNLATQVADLVSEQYDSNNVIFDAVPTAGHGNGYTVTSEGIKDALDAINNPAASAVSYDNTDSGLTATNAQDAIDEVNDKADTNATNIGDLSQLTTSVTSSLVGAVNSLKNSLKQTKTLIIDRETISTGSTHTITNYSNYDALFFKINTDDNNGIVFTIPKIMYGETMPFSLYSRNAGDFDTSSYYIRAHGNVKNGLVTVTYVKVTGWSASSAKLNVWGINFGIGT